MRFTLGLEKPVNEDTAIGIAIPALDIDKYAAYSASDTPEDIEHNASEAIELIIDEMLRDSFDVGSICDLGISGYRSNPNYSHCSEWVSIDVDISVYSGNKKGA